MQNKQEHKCFDGTLRYPSPNRKFVFYNDDLTITLRYLTQIHPLEFNCTQIHPLVFNCLTQNHK